MVSQWFFGVMPTAATTVVRLAHYRYWCARDGSVMAVEWRSNAYWTQA